MLRGRERVGPHAVESGPQQRGPLDRQLEHLPLKVDDRVRWVVAGQGCLAARARRALADRARRALAARTDLAARYLTGFPARRPRPRRVVAATPTRDVLGDSLQHQVLVHEPEPAVHLDRVDLAESVILDLGANPGGGVERADP